jgi:hypothetical protein
MEKATAFEKLTLLEVGPEKGGKSRLAATGRKPVLFLDYDRRAAAVSGIPGVFAITKPLIDPAWPNQPTAYQQTLNILGELEQHKIDLGDASGPKLPKTLVFDSVASFAKCAGAYAWFTTPDIRRTISVGGQQFHLPKGFDGWNAEMSLVESAILRALAIPDLDVICTLHEQPEEAPESTNEKPSFTGKFAIYPTRYKLLLKWFNEVWRVTREDANGPKIQVVPNWQFTSAATNLGITLVDKPDISYLIDKALSNGHKP